MPSRSGITSVVVEPMSISRPGPSGMYCPASVARACQLADATFRWFRRAVSVFVDTETARRNHLKVASANWHALATLAGQYMPEGPGLLIDIGSTTTDVIPLLDGIPIPQGMTDPDRLARHELIYTGVRRTPVCAVTRESVAAELFATTRDVYLVLGM